MISAVESVKPTKGSKGRPKSKKAKASALMTVQDDTQVGSSFIEPEDDDFEVKVARPVASKAKGKKRKSEEMTGAVETSSTKASRKRRTTARDSTASDQAAPDTHRETGYVDRKEDTHMEGHEEDARQPSKDVPKKGKKGIKKRGSTARKGHTYSTASEASLRTAAPDDDELDAVLVVDLDRPLTDDGEDEEPKVLKLPKGRRLTRNKCEVKSTDASTAPTRRKTRNSAVTAGESLLEGKIAISASTESQLQPAEDDQEATIQPIPLTKTQKKTGTRKASAKEKAKVVEVREGEEVQATTNQEAEDVKPKKTRGRKPSKQISKQDNQISNIPITHADQVMEPQSESSLLGALAQEDELAPESEIKNDRMKSGRKASTTAKATKSKRGGPQIRNVDDFDQPVEAPATVVEGQDAATVPADDVQEGELNKPSKKPRKKQVKAAKPGSKAKGKKNAVESQGGRRSWLHN